LYFIDDLGWRGIDGVMMMRVAVFFVVAALTAVLLELT
jgi:hypothetical protein